LRAPAQRDAFAPAGRDSNHLERVQILTGWFGAAVIDQIDLERAGFSLIPGNLAHWDAARHPIGWLRRFARQAWRLLAEAFETALDTGDTDAGALGQNLVSKRPFAMGNQQVGGGEQCWCQTFGTALVETLPDQSQRILNPRAVGLTALGSARLAREARAVQPAKEAFAMQVGYGLHFVQQAALLSTVGQPVAWAPPSEVFAAFGKRHLWVVLHGPLSNIFP
jgi:hypothetical protein